MICACAGAAGGWYGFLAGRDLVRMVSRRTTAIRDVTGPGQVEVNGRVRCTEPMEVPGSMCAYQRVVQQVRARQPSAYGSGRYWRTLTTAEYHRPFEIDDGSGRLGVDLENAEVHAPRIYRHVERAESLFGVLAVAPPLHSTRVTVSGLRVDETIYAIGAVVRTPAGGLALRTGAEKLIVMVGSEGRAIALKAVASLGWMALLAGAIWLATYWFGS